MKRFIGNDVQRLRPGDRFLVELAYTGVNEIGGALEEMMWAIIDEYNLDESSSAFIEKNLSNVTDFVEIFTFLRSQNPGRVCFSSCRLSSATPINNEASCGGGSD